MALAMNPTSGQSSAPLSPRAPVALVVLKWVRRALALALAAFWSVFFFEHIGEWYAHPEQGFPPAWVGGMMVAHLAMIAGLLMMLRWARVGSIVATIGAVGFLAIFGVARHTLHMPYLVLYSLVPVGVAVIELVAARMMRTRDGV